MSREMSLIVVLMSASIAAATAAPGIALLGPLGGGTADRAAGEGTEVAWPSTASAPASADRRTACQPDAGSVYRQWHHGNARLRAGCSGAAVELAEVAELQ